MEGQLGFGSGALAFGQVRSVDTTAVKAPPGETFKAKQLSCGGTHCCALTTYGKVRDAHFENLRTANILC